MDAAAMHTLTVGQAMTLLRDRTLSPVELVDAVIARIEATEATVHAYATVRADEARAEAKQAEHELAGGAWKGPLHGIPVALKDVFLTEGLATEAGSRVMQGFVPNRDSAVASSLKAGGAIIIGKTVTQEFAYGQNIPQTRNPWGLRYFPGGSSAGSGVAVAVDSAMAAMGTDTGGSIRVPAAINGVAGLKPTFGRVSKRGIVSLSTTMDHCGPLAKNVEDLALLLAVVEAPRHASSTGRAMNDLHMGVAGLRFGVDSGYHLDSDVSSEVRKCFESALDTFRHLGAELIEVDIPYIQDAVTAGITIILSEASAYHQRTLREKTELYEPGTRFILELGELILATDYLRAQQLRRLMADSARQAFENHRLDVLVSPTLPNTAIPLGELSSMNIEALCRYTIPFNLTGQPAVTIPCGYDNQDGVPIGLQIAGRPFDDLSVLRVAQAFEGATPWHASSPSL
jgi:aspartyl-tRNA(Asn)/glutamyl-tRNA(Gln) amidotransferase subunit A